DGLALGRDEARARRRRRWRLLGGRADEDGKDAASAAVIEPRVGASAPVRSPPSGAAPRRLVRRESAQAVGRITIPPASASPHLCLPLDRARRKSSGAATDSRARVDRHDAALRATLGRGGAGGGATARAAARCGTRGVRRDRSWARCSTPWRATGG